MKLLTEKGIVQLRPTWKYRVWVWLYGWCEVAEGVVIILTGGVWRPMWALNCSVHILKNRRKFWQ